MPTNAESLGHTDTSGMEVNSDNSAFTFMESNAEQPIAFVALTKYVVVKAGWAVTLVPEEALSEAEGDQLNSKALCEEKEFNAAAPPGHMAVSALVVRVGRGRTSIVTIAVS